MSSSTPARHIAIVPVSELDKVAEQALEYASTLTPHVVAVHVREPGAREAGELEVAWANGVPTVPLMVLDGPGRRWQEPFLQAVDVLRRTMQAEHVTVVLSPRGSEQDLTLLDRHGVAVRRLPVDDSLLA